MGTLSIDGNDYEVYGTDTERDIYFAGAAHASAYVAASTTVRDQAHISATRMIDRQTWLGDKTVEGQDPSAFPRDITEDVIPQNVIDATYELSLVLIEDSAAAGNADTSSNIKNVKAGSARVEFFKPEVSKGRFPTIVQELLKDYISSSAGLSLVHANTNAVSVYDGNEYTLSRGL